MTEQPYQSQRLASVYHSGNLLPARSLRAWVELIGSFSRTPAAAIVDVGTGTGMFATAMAETLAAPVVGLDPSLPMLREAVRVSRHPRVRYAVGDAGAVPTAEQRFDLALLSRVVHHLPDRARCFRELWRVLRPDGVVVIRTTVRDRLDALVYDYWPGLREADAHRFPAADDLVDEAACAGFDLLAQRSFAQPVMPGLRAYYHAMSTCPQSKFAQLSAEEFAAGLARLRRDADLESAPVAVEERYDVLAFARVSRCS